MNFQHCRDCSTRAAGLPGVFAACGTKARAASGSAGRNPNPGTPRGPVNKNANSNTGNTNTGNTNNSNTPR